MYWRIDFQVPLGPFTRTPDNGYVCTYAFRSLEVLNLLNLCKIAQSARLLNLAFTLFIWALLFVTPKRSVRAHPWSSLKGIKLFTCISMRLKPSSFFVFIIFFEKNLNFLTHDILLIENFTFSGKKNLVINQRFEWNGMESSTWCIRQPSSSPSTLEMNRISLFGKKISLIIRQRFKLNFSLLYLFL